MYSEKVEWYGEFIKNELQKLVDNSVTGNYLFTMHIKEGGLTGVVCGMNKSVRMPKD